MLVSVGIPCLIAFTCYTVDRRLKASVKRQLAAVAAMTKCDPNHAEWTQHAVKMFEAFDTDLSGEIDQKEMRELIELVHPEIPRRLAKEATLEAKVHADHEGQLDHSAFVDALNASEVYIRDHMHEYPNWAKARELKGSDCSLLISKPVVKRGFTARRRFSHTSENTPTGVSEPKQINKYRRGAANTRCSAASKYNSEQPVNTKTSLEAGAASIGAAVSTAGAHAAAEPSGLLGQLTGAMFGEAASTKPARFGNAPNLVEPDSRQLPDLSPAASLEITARSFTGITYTSTRAHGRQATGVRTMCSPNVTRIEAATRVQSQQTGGLR